ncbi:hypothetical protein D7006_21455 [Xanthobacter sp. YC-JY1]|nr:hypothetical protein D7006_21455 [Xanthobacter sp. YC-JY1]
MSRASTSGRKAAFGSLARPSHVDGRDKPGHDGCANTSDRCVTALRRLPSRERRRGRGGWRGQSSIGTRGATPLTPTLSRKGRGSAAARAEKTVSAEPAQAYPPSCPGLSRAPTSCR